MKKTQNKGYYAVRGQSRSFKAIEDGDQSEACMRLPIVTMHKIARVWQMDRQTDGRTPFSSLVRTGIPCSAEKICNKKVTDFL